MDDRKEMVLKRWMALNLHGRYLHAVVEFIITIYTFRIFCLMFSKNTLLHSIKNDFHLRPFPSNPSYYTIRFVNSYTLLLLIFSRSKKDSFCSITSLTDGIFPATEK